MMILHSNIAHTFNFLEMSEEALQHVEQAIEISQKFGFSDFTEKLNFRKSKALSLNPERL
jgi:hypothetical protein